MYRLLILGLLATASCGQNSSILNAQLNQQAGHVSPAMLYNTSVLSTKQTSTASHVNATNASQASSAFSLTSTRASPPLSTPPAKTSIPLLGTSQKTAATASQSTTQTMSSGRDNSNTWRVIVIVIILIVISIIVAVLCIFVKKRKEQTFRLPEVDGHNSQELEPLDSAITASADNHFKEDAEAGSDKDDSESSDDKTENADKAEEVTVKAAQTTESTPNAAEDKAGKPRAESGGDTEHKAAEKTNGTEAPPDSRSSASSLSLLSPDEIKSIGDSLGVEAKGSGGDGPATDQATAGNTNNNNNGNGLLAPACARDEMLSSGGGPALAGRAPQGGAASILIDSDRAASSDQNPRWLHALV